MKDITTEEKIEYIEQTRSFGEIRQAWFPPSASTEYYFVSYCHADYKAVFRDLFGMQAVDPEFSVWYDRELIAGKDWKAEAQKHIYDFNCKGVIFYVSENSVKSPAVLEEIKMTRDAGKAFLPIMLPMGETYMSGAELFDKTVDCDGEAPAKALYAEMFGKDITYLKLSDEPEHKVKAIRKSLRGEPLLKFGSVEFEPEDDDDDFDLGAEVLACKNIDIIELGLNDFISEDKALAQCDKMSIGICAFANCGNLQSVNLPKNVSVIKEFAFFGCGRLKTLTIPAAVIDIYDSAFARCTSLEVINLPRGVDRIRSFLFEGCMSLRQVLVEKNLKEIGERALIDCTAIEMFDFAESYDDAFYSDYTIGEQAFRNCISLKSLKLPFGLNEIAYGTFMGCASLESVDFPETLTEINVNAFRDCALLRSVDLTRCVTRAQADKAAEFSSVTNAFRNGGVTKIWTGAFYNCSNLERVALPKNLKTLYKSAFGNTAIKDIYYDGNMDQWHAIKKYPSWDSGTPDYIVHCSDGDIKKVKI